MIKFSLIRPIFAIFFLLTAEARAAETPKFELLHLWLHETEVNAAAAIKDEMVARGVEWTESASRARFGGIRTEYANRLALGIPPTGVLWIGDAASAHSLVQDGVFRWIDPAEVNVDFKRLLIPEIYQELENMGGLSLLPLGIHLHNHVLYNKRILNELGVDEPRSWPEFFEMAELAKARGYYAISMSDQRFQIRFLMNSVMSGEISRDDLERMEALQKLGDEWRAPLKRIFANFIRLRNYANPDTADLSWWDATNHVVDGRAVAVFLGDFTSPLIKTPEDMSCTLGPGADYTLWSFDALALSKTDEPEEVAGQDILMDVVSNPEVMEKYIRRKGGIPAYRNVDVSKLAPCSQQSVKYWSETPGKLLLASVDWGTAIGVVATVAENLWHAYPAMSVDEAVDAVFGTMDVSVKSLDGGR